MRGFWDVLILLIMPLSGWSAMACRHALRLSRWSALLQLCLWMLCTGVVQVASDVARLLSSSCILSQELPC